MTADRTSLTELGLLPDHTGAWPLGAWIDTTHSRRGHDALKRLIAAPLGDLTSLGARQALLPPLVGAARVIPWAELLPLAEQVERFLASNYEIVPAALVGRTVVALRLRHVITHVSQELRAVNHLLSTCEQVYARIGAPDGDPAFTAVLSAFAAALAHPGRERLRVAVERGNPIALAGLDAMVRDARLEGVDDMSMRASLLSLVEAVWQLDAFCSIATASSAVEGVLPTIAPRGVLPLELHGLRHPLLLKGEPNDVTLSSDDRVLFLTGPNMAGKSTVLRAIGIAVHCAHLGMAVPARVARIPLYDGLLVSFTVRDNLQRGESLYLAEIRRVRKIVAAVDRGDAVLAIFDEVFRGTNIKDATQATTLLVDGLARARHGTFVIASHLAEVAESRAGCEGVACWCMEVDVSGSEPRFTYRMRRGVSDVHLGMVLLDAEGVGPMLRRMRREERAKIASTGQGAGFDE